MIQNRVEDSISNLSQLEVFPTSAPVIFIVGPTAVGKSGLALTLARTFDGEIIGADSRQVYRLMDIGTAKPSSEDRAEIRHHLIDILDPDQEFSLALFLDLAHQAIQDIHGRDKLPIVVGGTGQYIWALLEGWQVPHIPPNPELRQELEERANREGPDSLHRTLYEIDAETASKINPHNLRRVIRALETYYATGIAPSTLRRKQSLLHHHLIIGLTTSREDLYGMIDSRVDEMLANGLVDEVRSILDMGCSLELPCMSSMGYKETALHLMGELTLEEASQRIKYETHRFARRQYAWFRLKDPRIHWLEVDDNPGPRAEALVRGLLTITGEVETV